MRTFYFSPAPELPIAFTGYCELHKYPLSVKKMYIVEQVFKMQATTDVDTLRNNVSLYCSGVSKSSVYQVLQWMTENGFVQKNVNGHAQKILYSPVGNRTSRI